MPTHEEDFPTTTVTVSCEGLIGDIEPEAVRQQAQRLLELVDQSSAELSIVLCDDPFIHDLNREYRNIDTPTDVLSFSMNEGDIQNPHPEVLGDIVISVETASRQAIGAGHCTMDEVTFLLVHGLLHLLGYDHEKADDEMAMNRESKRLLDMIEFPHLQTPQIGTIQ